MEPNFDSPVFEETLDKGYLVRNDHKDPIDDGRAQPEDRGRRDEPRQGLSGRA